MITVNCAKMKWNSSCCMLSCIFTVLGHVCVHHLSLPVTVYEELVPVGPEAVQWEQAQDKVPCLHRGEEEAEEEGGDQLTQLCHCISQRVRQCDKPTLAANAHWED